MKYFPVAALLACAIAGSAFAKDAPLYKTQDCGKEMVQMGMNACAGANLDAANAALNGVYRKLMAQQTDAKSKAQLKDLERAWIAYRDKECGWEIGPEQDGGSIWPMDMDNCLEDKTDAHIRELNHMLDCPEGDVTCRK
jgi:uncharacterized protein YecT (DUF1311 family)